MKASFLDEGDGAAEAAGLDGAALVGLIVAADNDGVAIVGEGGANEGADARIVLVAAVGRCTAAAGDTLRTAVGHGLVDDRLVDDGRDPGSSDRDGGKEGDGDGGDLHFGGIELEVGEAYKKSVGNF